jgi:Zn-dependent peptidase ImmA (M78 family)
VTNLDVKSIAQLVLREKGLGQSLPINLSTLHEAEAVDVVYFDSTQEFDGRFELCLGRPTIYVNTRFRGSEHPRVRFTRAHELGHFFLHRRFLRRGRVFVDKVIHFGDQSDEFEREANEFASECLLPTSLILAFLERCIPSLALVKQVAEQAKASLPATAIKLAELTTACLCFFWIEQRVVRWSAPSHRWKEHRYRWFGWHGCSVDGSMAATADAECETIAVPRDVWCPRAPQRTEPLFESAFSTPFGTLVLVLDLADFSTS